MQNMQDYFKNLTPEQKAALDHVRQVVKQQVPQAEEVISYGIPAFKYKGRMLIYFAAFKNHFSIYPASDAMIAAVGEELAKFRASKGTLHFTKEQPLPDSLLKKIIEFRLKNINDSKRDYR